MWQQKGAQVTPHSLLDSDSAHRMTRHKLVHVGIIPKWRADHCVACLMRRAVAGGCAGGGACGPDAG